MDDLDENVERPNEDVRIEWTGGWSSARFKRSAGQRIKLECFATRFPTEEALSLGLTNSLIANGE